MRTVFRENNVDALIIEKPIDLFYLTGLKLSLGTLLIFKNGARLFVDGRYLGFAKKHSPCPAELTNTESIIKALSPYAKIGFDSFDTSYCRWEALEKLSKKQLTATYPSRRTAPAALNRLQKSKRSKKAQSCSGNVFSISRKASKQASRKKRQPRCLKSTP
jgi:Xaa-Pro aminopeptidase